MSTQAVSAHGTSLSVSSGGEFVAIAEVLDIDGPGIEAETDIVRSADPDSYPVVLVTGIEPGEVSFDVNYLGDASQGIIHAAAISHEELTFLITFPTSPEQALEFTGIVTEFEFSAPVDGKLTASMTIIQTSHALAV